MTVRIYNLGMRISDIGEFGLIERLSLIVNGDLIGDDCAVVEIQGSKLLLTTDALVEGVHFLKDSGPESIGWKAVSVNVSDIVAGGGRPMWILISLILPDIKVSFVERIYEGISSACKFYDCRVAGGNVSKGEALIIDVFALGKTSRPVGRGGAEPGDLLFVSGTLGDSRAGLELLKEDRKSYEPYELALIERHTRPTARIDYANHISKYAGASIDISDGLLLDAEHLAKRSGVRLEIDSSRLPISEELKRFCAERGKDPIEYALRGGEDYQLLFCHREKDMNPFLDMTVIGKVSEGTGVFVDGDRMGGGFSHF